MPSDPTPPEPLRTVTTYAYDGDGRAIRAIDCPGLVTTTVYEVIDGVVRRVSPPPRVPDAPPDEPFVVG
jgi:YD repeat-containing protein